MTDPDTSPLWNQFNLREANPDPGGGILYAVNYNTENLLTHRASVAETLTNIGATIFEMNGGLAVDLAGAQAPDYDRVRILIEELSVVNEAVEYHESGFAPTTIEQAADEARKLFTTALVRDKDLAFDVANIFISQVVRDLRTAHSQNDVLSVDEYATVEELSEYGKTRAEQIANGDISTFN